MRIFALLIVAFILIACTPVAEVPVVEPTSPPAEEVPVVAATPEPVEETPPPEAVQQTGSTAHIVSREPELSPTEKWAAHFKEEYGTYFYIVDDPRFGELAVYRFENKTKYTSPDQLFEVKNGEVVLSKWYNTASTDRFKERVKEREIPVMNYINEEKGIYTGCYVWLGYYKMENCIKDNTTNSTPIIHKDFRFTPPVSPLEWLGRFDGQEPLFIRTGYTYKDVGNMLHLVDQAWFPYNGTIAVLYIHQEYNIPLRVDVLDANNKTQSSTVYQFITPDLNYVKRHYPFFLDS